jgi:GNAT superfamily N-acetyltransferase
MTDRRTEPPVPDAATANGDAMKIEVHPLNRDRADDFYRLHGPENGAGWCYCAAWQVPTWEGWGDRTAEQNRAVRQNLFDAGECDGYLLYADGEPAAWCQAGPRDRLTKLVAQYHMEPDPQCWAITCLFTAPKFRAAGLTAELLRQALAHMKLSGVKKVQAFPRCGQNLPPEDLWTGPEQLFLSLGFGRIKDHPQWPILQISWP